MNQPVQHHYLPKHAYLNFFESPDKGDFVWMYQRNKEPILANIDKVAKERHLYSFTDTNGKYNTQLETIFAEMEQVASKILKKLNNAVGQVSITTQEKTDLAYFLAIQVARTPAFRDSLKEQTAEFAKLNMQMLASNKEAFANTLKGFKERNPDKPDINEVELKEYILSEKYEMKMTGEDYFLKQAIELGDAIFPAIMMKDIFILRSSSEELITSDYPVNLIANPAIPPFYAGGFLLSGILFPIGKKTALFCKNPNDPKDPPSKDEEILVGFKEIPPVQARWANKIAIKRAERFLFSSSHNSKIQDIFNKSSKPKRFYMSSPFSNKS